MDVVVWLKSTLQHRYPDMSFQDISDNVSRHLIDGLVSSFLALSSACLVLRVGLRGGRCG